MVKRYHVLLNATARDGGRSLATRSNIAPNTRRKISVFSNESITTRKIAAPASGWLFAKAWLNAMADESESDPILEKQSTSSSSSRNTPSESVPRRLNLLLAEDNLPDALLVREAIRFENLPLEVHVASDGQRAIDFIVQSENDPNAPCPHILLLDINLPKADGFEVLRRVRNSDRCGKAPVLMFSSSDSPADRSQATKLGAGYFRKPPSYDEFLKLGAVLKKLLTDNGLL
jgi:CheY-like chemotaxis protein